MCVSLLTTIRTITYYSNATVAEYYLAVAKFLTCYFVFICMFTMFISLTNAYKPRHASWDTPFNISKQLYHYTLNDVHCFAVVQLQFHMYFDILYRLIVFFCLLCHLHRWVFGTEFILSILSLYAGYNHTNMIIPSNNMALHLFKQFINKKPKFLKSNSNILVLMNIFNLYVHVQ